MAANTTSANTVRGSLRLAPIKKDQNIFRVQVLFQVTDLGLYAPDLHGTKTVLVLVVVATVDSSRSEP